MSERKQFRAIKGTRDILPPDSALWNWFEHTAREVFESYSFGEIRLPTFEETEVFARAIGVETDVVSKEMYTFEAVEASFAAIDALLRYISIQKVAPRDSSAIARLKADLQELGIQFKRPEVAQELAKNPANQQRLSVLERAAGQVGRVESLDGTPGFQSEFAAVVREIQNSAETLILGQSLTLRPEATASVCRAYIEHNMQALPGNQKLYYIGPMFRRERPQKGRYRQFYQIGAEVLGQSDAPAIDAEVLEMLLVFFNRVGLTRTTLYVNSIGDKNCRPRYVELLREELRRVKDRLKEDSQRRIETNPLRVLDSKIPEEQPIIETLPRISDHLCDECRAHFAKLKEELNLRRIDYKENWRLVRGLDYYTRTTFEVTAEGLGSQNAVCGGGRYDGLVELLGGPPTKGIGFAIGTDRSILSIEESGDAPKLGGLAVYIAWMGQASYPTAVDIARKLRAAGLSVELPPEEMKFKKSLGLADKLGARYALIIGEDEVASRTFTLKRLADSDQKKFAEGELLEYVESERRR
jgi:histidyl-tRNA synthetase